MDKKTKKLILFISNFVFFILTDIFFWNALHINSNNMIIFIDGVVMAVYNIMSIELMVGKYFKKVI
ncbi:hypothetical protein [Methanosarcina sp. UBA5]|uniref:hypothetical protein n=1 Tax=Methanosarcina sp. UBA5 TaxID=1915593 RepID=UPI0025DF7739|nr:hypothetical protein [Methanosarcina sp. UBA5]